MPIGINCKLDTAKNILQTYDEYGYITISAMAVNSSTTNEMQDENGNTIISSVKIWVGPKVDSLLKNTEKMIATAGANTITLEGKCLEDNMKAGLFDARWQTDYGSWYQWKCRQSECHT